MIRTRDFAAFAAALLFLLTAITATWLTGSLSSAGQVASVINFAPPPSIEGAESYENVNSRDENVARLRSKIAAGDGDVSIGEPVFTSVDDIQLDDTSITDQTPPSSVQIGITVDGLPLRSDELWRFIGYTQMDQIGTALNSLPLFGARIDNVPLDQCGGANDGSGYKFYLQSGIEVSSECYTSTPPSL